ncbi:hypothetical protein KO528_19460 [Saccharophagus degradans]|uniref:RiboL-PSP-HEPN domain-containing protein n=1 Tax=Saccharophagus degradans TaxID=86304 RepID=A0AAW7XB11_9GAMM|nr:hypothetical protein [Saccharophagus degradans]MBU2987551.1 hypothetical protein [Saccharophagus degradans]MDO6424724.1 hypothetical protein [Saccharophagus degradans]MDO6609524.1 hypothetical protein [Saccharophagus degradans]
MSTPKTFDISNFKQSLTNDGRIVVSSRQGKEIEIDSNGRLEGLTDASRKIIVDCDLNSIEQVKLRFLFRNLAEIESELDIEYLQKPITYLRRSLADCNHLNISIHRLERDNENNLRRMIYANVITSLEAFLSDFLLCATKNDRLIQEKLINGLYSNEKYKLSDLLESNKSPIDLLIDKINTNSFHNLNTVRNHYSKAFSINFPSFGSLCKAVENRHDIIHRNGCPLGESESKNFSQKEVTTLISSVAEFSIELLKEIARSTQQTSYYP